LRRGWQNFSSIEKRVTRLFIHWEEGDKTFIHWEEGDKTFHLLRRGWQ
jgi:hypothetical protein